MKIAYIYPENFPSKKARAISVIYTAHELSLISDTVLFIAQGAKDKILKTYSLENSKLSIKSIKKSYLDLKSNKFFNFNLLKELKKQNFDFIYVRHLKTAKFLIEKGFKVIFECHEIFHKSNPKTKAIEEFIYSNAKGLIFINNTLKNEFNNCFNIKNIPQATVHNGCGFKLDYIKKDFSQLKDIYYIGNFYPWKGLDFLIQEISNTNLQLKIIGDGDRKEELQKYIREHNITNIEFLGYKTQDEIKNILSTSLLTVIPNTPSIFSNFSSPIKLYEYLMTSNIVLSSNMPTIKEIIINKENGFLFESGDATSFKNVLEQILSLKNSDLLQIAKKAYETSKEFTWKKRAENIYDFIKKLNTI